MIKIISTDVPSCGVRTSGSLYKKNWNLSARTLLLELENLVFVLDCSFQEADVQGSISSKVEWPLTSCLPSQLLFRNGDSDLLCNPAPSLLLCSEIFYTVRKPIKDPRDIHLKIIMTKSSKERFPSCVVKRKGKTGIHRFNLFSQLEELLNKLQLENRNKI